MRNKGLQAWSLLILFVLEIYLFLKKYIISEAAMYYNVSYSQQLSIARYQVSLLC